MEIVINSCFGGFGLSHEAVMRYAELKGIKLYPFIDRICREVYMKTYGKLPTMDDIKDSMALFVSYALVPQEEFEAIEEEESKKPISEGRYERTNALYFNDMDILRDDAILIQVVRELKNKANGRCAKLKIVKIPDGVDWEIEEYDGFEHIAEKHRTWD